MDGPCRGTAAAGAGAGAGGGGGGELRPLPSPPPLVAALGSAMVGGGGVPFLWLRQREKE